jgi:hypothetical protein
MLPENAGSENKEILLPFNIRRWWNGNELERFSNVKKKQCFRSVVM